MSNPSRVPLCVTGPGMRFRTLLVACVAVLQLLGATEASSQFPATLDLVTDGEDLLVIGRQQSQKVGRVLAGGDINGDGFGDLIIGAAGASPLGRQGVGEVDIVWGGTTIAQFVDLGVDAAPVSRIFGESGRAGLSMSLSTGDYNGDGYCDILLGLPFEPPYTVNDGIAYVIWGSSEFPDTLDLDAMPSQVTYLYPRKNSGGHLGWSSTSGDVNNDGYDDIVISAVSYENRSHVFLLLGQAEWPHTVGLSGSAPAIKRIIDVSKEEGTGWGLACGDLNGDGFEDLVVGAPGNVPLYFDGKATVIFGASTIPDTMLIADMLEGVVRIIPPETPPNVVTHIGETGTLAVADVNNDGFGDLLISSRGMSTDQYDGCGGAWLLFGSWTFPDTVDLANPSIPHVVMHGQGDVHDYGAVVVTGDVDGDGHADMVITNDNGEVAGEDRSEVLVVYGSSITGDTIDLAADTIITRITGEDVYSKFGLSLGVVDLDGDGVDDLVIGAYRSARGGASSAGAVYALTGVAAEVNTGARVPPQFSVREPYPTPSAGIVTLPIRTPQAGEFHVEIFDVLGRRIAAERLTLKSGWTSFEWDGLSDRGRRVPSGLYFARVQHRSGFVTRKMVIVR